MINKKTEDIEINDIEYKQIRWEDEFGIFICKNQPKNINQNETNSGAHIFRDRPDQDHYDVWSEGRKIKVMKRDNPTMKFDMQFASGALIT